MNPTKIRAEAVDTKELYKQLVLNDFGTKIYITDDGEIETMEKNNFNDPEERLLFGTASGDFSGDDWGIRYHYDDDIGDTWYEVEDMEGQWTRRSDAFEAALDEFGLRAEDVDLLMSQIEARIVTEREAAEEIERNIEVASDYTAAVLGRS